MTDGCCWGEDLPFLIAAVMRVFLMRFLLLSPYGAVAEKVLLLVVVLMVAVESRTTYCYDWLDRTRRWRE